MNDGLARREQEPGQKPNAFLQGVCVLGMLGLLGYFGAHDKPVTAVMAAGICLAALFALSFDRIGKLRLKTKDLVLDLQNATRNANEAAQDAKATVAQLRTLAALLGKLELDNLALRNRIGALPPSLLLEVRDEVSRVLGVAGCSHAEIERAHALLMTTIRFDLAAKIVSTAWEEFRKSNPQSHKRFTEAVEPLRNPGSFSVPGPEEYRRVLGQLNALSETVTHTIEAYERFERTGEVPSYKGDLNYYQGEL